MPKSNYYDSNAKALCEQYNSVNPAVAHSRWQRFITDKTGLACDIGAGSGRDANWLAESGWDVIAVEPSAAMREQAIPYSHPNITWLDDKLPTLDKLRTIGRGVAELCQETRSSAC